MHKVHKDKQRAIAVLDEHETPHKMHENAMWVEQMTVQHEVGGNRGSVDCLVAYGFQSAPGVFQRTRLVKAFVQNIHDGPQYYHLLIAHCGDFMAVSPTKVLEFIALHPENPQFAELGPTAERYVLDEADKRPAADSSPKKDQ